MAWPGAGEFVPADDIPDEAEDDADGRDGGCMWWCWGWWGLLLCCAAAALSGGKLLEGSIGSCVCAWLLVLRFAVAASSGQKKLLEDVLEVVAAAARGWVP